MGPFVSNPAFLTLVLRRLTRIETSYRELRWADSSFVFLCGPPPFSIPRTALGFRIPRGWLRYPAWLRIQRRGSGNRPRVCGGLESGDPYTRKVLKLMFHELNADSATHPVCALTNASVLTVCSN